VGAFFCAVLRPCVTTWGGASCREGRSAVATFRAWVEEDCGVLTVAWSQVVGTWHNGLVVTAHHVDEYDAETVIIYINFYELSSRKFTTQNNLD